MSAIAAAKTLIQKQTATPAGTGTIATTGTAVAGTGTAFTTETPVGSVIYAGGFGRVVVTVTSDTAMVVNEAWPNDLAALSTFTYVTFSNMVGASDLSGPAQQASQIDVSSFSSTGYKEQISGLRDPGSLDMTVWFQPKDTTHAALQADFDAGTVIAWRVWIPDAADGAAPPDLSNSRMVMFGTVNQVSFSAGTDGAWQASLTVLLSGKPVMIVGVD
jgi:hypothetical protein